MFGGIHLKSCILRLNKQHQEGGWGIMSSRAPILEETVRKHIRKMPHPQDYLRQEFLATDGDEKKEGQLSPWQQDQALASSVPSTDRGSGWQKKSYTVARKVVLIIAVQEQALSITS